MNVEIVLQHFHVLIKCNQFPCHPLGLPVVGLTRAVVMITRHLFSRRSCSPNVSRLQNFVLKTVLWWGFNRFTNQTHISTKICRKTIFMNILVLRNIHPLVVFYSIIVDKKYHFKWIPSVFHINSGIHFINKSTRLS